MKSTRKVTHRDWPAIQKVIRTMKVAKTTKVVKTRVVVVDGDNRIQGIYMDQTIPQIKAAIAHARSFDTEHRVYSAPSGKMFARGHDDVLDESTILCEWLQTGEGRVVSIPRD